MLIIVQHERALLIFRLSGASKRTASRVNEHMTSIFLSS